MNESSDERRRASEISHESDVELGGSAKRSTMLRVLPAGWRPREGVPATRADCPTYRPCDRVRCEWNTWMEDGRDRPGRRGADRDLPASRVVVKGRYNCGADIADAVARGKDLSPQVIADAYEITERQARRIKAKAMAKAQSEPGVLEALQLMTRR